MRDAKTFIKSQLEQNVSLLDLYKTIQQDLQKVESTLELFTKSKNPLISEISDYLFKKAGKRIRPALLMLCARLFGYEGDDHILMSALVETIHTASLIHDDIIDHSDIRRGRPTVHATWGPNITVLLGDYLYIKTLNLAVQSKHREVIQILTDTSAQMIDGELYEYYMSRNLQLDEKDYLDILDKKTASLFRASCLIGGILCDTSEKERELLAAYGRNLGMSFQVVDDLLDYTGDIGTLGKPVLSDLEEGRITLPLIYTLNHDGKKNQDRIIQLIQKKDFGKETKSEILAIVESNGALEYTYRKAERYALKSKEILNHFPPSIYRDSLDLVPDFVLNRNL
ncbi:MAG: polyprenyl synthetase family protein [Candidatus Aminicenantes bacterium]|jgi:octaprenyl-diphosphate synthase